jgi:hypothetical protein
LDSESLAALLFKYPTANNNVRKKDGSSNISLYHQKIGINIILEE